MDRRQALQAMGASATGLFLPGSVQSALVTGNRFYGWCYNRKSITDFIRRHRYPYFSQQNARIKGTGKGKKMFLHLALEQVMQKPFQPHTQGAPDCVSHAAALGVDILSAVQIALQKKPQRWIAETASEPIYGGSRVEIGGYNGPGGGSTGHWAAEWLQEYGVLLRQSYPSGHDFTYYDAVKAVELGRSGCPDSLEPVARLHPVKQTAICRNYEELCDSIYNGSPVMVCSNVGFGDGVARRDSEGFLTRRRSPWYHAMLFAGYDDEFYRPGALCFNSWGQDWIEGPTRGHQPAGTFWIDARTVTSMLEQGDSFSLSGFRGFPRIDIPPFIFY
jgi:hypothetical protein